jgi:hypothetical protein
VLLQSPHNDLLVRNSVCFYKSIISSLCFSVHLPLQFLRRRVQELLRRNNCWGCRKSCCAAIDTYAECRPQFTNNSMKTLLLVAG